MFSHLLGERRFLKKLFYYGILLEFLGGQSRILGYLNSCFEGKFMLPFVKKVIKGESKRW